MLHDVINVYTHMYKWQVAPKRYNTFSVGPRKQYLTQGSLRYRLTTLGYQKYNAYSVGKCVLIYYLRHDSLEYH